MSVPIGPDDRDPTTPADALVSKDTARAVEHRARIERGESEAVYGVQPALFSSFSLFPLSRPKGSEAAMWQHRNRFGSIAIQPGVTGDVVTQLPRAKRSTGAAVESGSSQAAYKETLPLALRLLPVPFGGLPRLLMVDIATEARRISKAGGDPSRIDLTQTLTGYATQRLGVAKGSRNRAVWEQLEALLKATITFTSVTARPDGREERWHRLHVADDLQLWVPNGPTLDGFEPYVHLAPNFLQMVLSEQVHPVRRDFLAKLAGKPMAMDVLLWLASETYKLHVSNKPHVDHSWDELFNTFTHSYGSRREFQKQWLLSLGQALEYYTGVKIDAQLPDPRDKRRTLVRVYRSPLLVPERSS